MFGPFSFSLLVSLILALTAFLQAEAKWWKGPALAIGLFIIDFLALFATAYQDQLGPNSPGLGLTAMWICASLVLVGAILGLFLRQFLSPGKIGVWVFGGGFTLIYMALLVYRFT